MTRFQIPARLGGRFSATMAGLLERRRRVKRVSGWVLTVMLGTVLGSSGCALEEGLRDGLSEGTSSALSATIETVVEAFVRQIFPK